MASEKELLDWLEPVQDPELFLSIVGLGLIYKCELSSEGKATVEMTLTSPGCPAGDMIVGDIRARLLEHPEVKDAEINIVWEPKWDPNEMATEDVKESLGIW